MEFTQHLDAKSKIHEYFRFNIMNLVVFSNGSANHVDFILASTIIARVVSAIANFLINRNLVFGNHDNGKEAFGKYIVLCVCIMLLSAGGTWVLSKVGISSTFAKIITDTILCFISYSSQQMWVFSPNNEKQ